MAGVCSTGNLELVRSLGADHVVDYTREDFTRGRRYDLIVDAVGNRSLRALRRALTPTGTLVIVGGKKGRLLGPLMLPLKAVVVNPIVDQQLGWFIANLAKEDLAYLGGLVDAGKVTPAVDRTYPLSETAEAVRQLETGHARGMTVITVERG